jgi:hypothetical protein
MSIKQTRHIAHMVEMEKKKSFKFLVEHEGTRALRKSRHTMEYNIKMDLEEIV